MTALNSGRLVYEGVSFPFGEGTPFALTMFQRGVASARAGDRDRPRADGRAFGRDLKEGPTHELGLVVQGAGGSRAAREASMAVLAGEFERVVDALPLRSRGGVLAQLWIGDRFCYGRPRDLTPDDSGRWDGVASYGLSFVAESDRWYGPMVSTQVRFSIPETGGLTFPAEAPFTFDSGPTQRNGVLVVGGDVETLPVFVIQGPVTNPSITVTGVGGLQLSVTLAYDQTLTVDCRNGWVMRDGSPLPGAVSPRGARLKDMALKPGSYEVVLRGYDPTGTGYLDVQVEPAFTTF